MRQVLESIGQLRRTVELERERLGRRLAGRLAAPPGVAEAYGPVLKHLEAELAALEAELAAAEDEYASVKQLPGELRRQRGAAVAELRRIQKPLLRLLATVFDTRRCTGIGSTPSDPQRLVAEASSTVDFLRRLERDPLPPALGVILDAGEAAADLEGARERLEEVLDLLTAAESDVTFARERAAAAIAHAESVGPWVVQAIEGLVGLAQVETVAGVVGKRA